MKIRFPLSAKLLGIVVVLAGCANTNEYVQPAADNIAWLSGKSVSNSFSDWESLVITAVDDKFVTVPFFGSPAKARVGVTPEPHRLVVHATFNRQFGGVGPFEAFIPVSFEPRRSGSYQLGGRVRDNVVEAWIEDRSAGERVSEVFAVPYKAKTQSAVYTYTPVYLPPASPPVSAVTVHIK